MNRAAQYLFSERNPRRPSLCTATAILEVAVTAQDLARTPVTLVVIGDGAAGSVHSTFLSPGELSALAHVVTGENLQACCGGWWFTSGPGDLQVEIRSTGVTQGFPVPVDADWYHPGADGRTPIGAEPAVVFVQALTRRVRRAHRKGLLTSVSSDN